MNLIKLPDTEMPEKDLLMDFEEIPEGIDLLPEHFQEAVEISNAQLKEAKQWQAYLNALALFAFEEWLAEREPNLAVKRANCSLLKPEYANLIPVVSNLETGGFKICLIVAGAIYEWVTVPRAAIELQEFTPHFYVLLDVEEELEIASIRGFLQRDELEKALSKLQPEPDWTYQLPANLFRADADDLLLYLCCLNSKNGAISLPTATDSRKSVLTKYRDKLAQTLPQLQEADLWEICDWEEGAGILTNPDLVRGIYQLQKGEVKNQKTYLSDLLKLATEKAVNAANWANNVIDEVGRSLSWNLILAPSPMRRAEKTPAEELGEFLKNIEEKTKVKIPPEARSSYLDLELAKNPLRLYAVTWPVCAVEKEWNLLCILTTVTAVGGDRLPLPPGIKLRVSDNTNLVSEWQVKADEKEPCYNCYIHVLGTWDEKFAVTVAMEEDGLEETTIFEWNA